MRRAKLSLWGIAVKRLHAIVLGVLSIGLALGATPSAKRAVAGPLCCRCGCPDNCCKVCRPVPDTKEVKKVCWDVKCEDVCVPGRSCCCGEVCKQDECGCWTYKIWKPNCGYVKTRKVLVKKEVTRKVPSTKWVVEDVCQHCRTPEDCDLPADGKLPHDDAKMTSPETPLDEAPGDEPKPEEPKPEGVKGASFFSRIFRSTADHETPKAEQPAAVAAPQQPRQFYYQPPSQPQPLPATTGLPGLQQ